MDNDTDMVQYGGGGGWSQFTVASNRLNTPLGKAAFGNSPERSASL